MGTLDNFFRSLGWRLKSYHLWLESLAITVREEINHPRKDLTLREKLRAWRYSPMSESHVPYGLRDKEPNAVHDYLSDMARFLKPGQIDGWYRHVLQDKLAFAASMAFNDHHYVLKIYAPIFATAQRHPVTDHLIPHAVCDLTTAIGRRSIRCRHAPANDDFSIQDPNVWPTAASTPA